MKHVPPFITFGIIHRLHYNTITLVLVFESTLPGGLIGPHSSQDSPFLEARSRCAHKVLVKMRLYSRLGRQFLDVVGHEGAHSGMPICVSFLGLRNGRLRLPSSTDSRS